MSMSTEYVIDRIDEAARFNTSNKQVCNEALCLARGRLQSLQNELEVKTRFIKELEDKLRKYEETEKHEEAEAKLERGEYVICKNEYGHIFEALYLGADYGCYIILRNKGFAVPQALNIHDWTLTKTGKHVHLFDIDEKGD